MRELAGVVHIYKSKLLFKANDGRLIHSFRKMQKLYEYLQRHEPKYILTRTYPFVQKIKTEDNQVKWRVIVSPLHNDYKEYRGRGRAYHHLFVLTGGK